MVYVYLRVYIRTIIIIIIWNTRLNSNCIHLKISVFLFFLLYSILHAHKFVLILTRSWWWSLNGDLITMIQCHIISINWSNMKDQKYNILINISCCCFKCTAIQNYHFRLYIYTKLIDIALHIYIYICSAMSINFVYMYNRKW